MVLDPTYSNQHDYGSIQSTYQNLQRTSTHAHLESRLNLSSREVPIDDEDGPISSNMTQGDLYQRQPLLPSPTKGEKWNHAHHSSTKEYYDNDGEDGDDIIRNGISGSNGIIKINVPPPVREEPKFPKEKWKTLLGKYVF